VTAIDVIKSVAKGEVEKLHLIEIGIVTSIFPHAGSGDPDNYQCNVKLKNQDLELRKVPVSTQRIGLASVPNVGDMVLIACINGDINAPVVIGRLYNDTDVPPVNDAGEIVYESPDPAKGGLRRLYMKFPNNVTLTITDDDVKVEAGKSVITMKTDGDITIESEAKIDIKSSGDMTLKGDNVKIESKSSLELKAGGSGRLEATGTLDVKGQMVNIN
jgi:phage baseplate assembly protein V